jgi:hypothetical protein
MPAAAATLYEDRKLAGLCTRCGGPAADDSSLCAKHRDDQRGRTARTMARIRAARVEAGLCVWCPGTRPTKVAAGETSCLACRIRRRRVKPLGGVHNDVHKHERIAARTATHADGRTRYHGQQRRGQQTHAQLNAQDVEMASECFDSFKAGLALIESAEVKALPRVQRDDVKAATAHQGERVGRHIDAVLERLGHFKQRHGRRDGTE